MTILSDNIKAYREALGYTQEQFCKLTGVSRQSLHKHESGKVNLSPETLAIYAQILKVDTIRLQSQMHPKTWDFAVYDSLQWRAKQE